MKVKLYNDVYGHQAGDMALITAANVIRSNMREEDTLIRYGGDEFLMVLPGIGEAEMDMLLDKICKAVYETEVPGYARLRLSASIGGVITGNEPIENAVGRADRLMYQAKNQKNRVVTEHSAVTEKNADIVKEEQTQGKQQILIVDDSDINREILSAMLCGEYRILEAVNGSECLEILQQQGTGISLVLLDIVMPVMDGFEVLSHMNRNHWIDDIPVILISGEDVDPVIRRAYEMGVSDYINRPFDAGIVCRRVFNTVKLYAKQRRLVSLMTAHINEREKNNCMMIDIQSHIVEFRNGESGKHVLHMDKVIQLLLDKIVQKTDKYPSLWQERDSICIA
ncbi:MAG: diguanylate cyclase [Lachnospiraceae bacterium]|nr:diguanylate cyclase [Lachnospiraceae bacterium]